MTGGGCAGEMRVIAVRMVRVDTWKMKLSAPFPLLSHHLLNKMEKNERSQDG